MKMRFKKMIDKVSLKIFFWEVRKILLLWEYILYMFKRNFVNFNIYVFFF